MKPETIALTACVLVFVILEIWRTQFFNKPKQKKSDGIVEITSAAVLTILTQPLAFAGGALLAAYFAPNYAGYLADWSFFAVFGLFLLFDDLPQYFWHRLSHTVPWLYNLHRPHHNAEYMSIRIIYRNNLFYYLMMPGLWLSGALVYFGGGWVYLAYLPIKMAVIAGAHSDVRWDKKLYDIAWLSPVMWVVERVISTPATHSAHHGKHADDGVTNYKGNYGNLLFFWDVLFGTAKITRRYPESFGVENMPETSAAEQLFWPIVRNNSESSEDKTSATISGA